jgi:hypothetical protein
MDKPQQTFTPGAEGKFQKDTCRSTGVEEDMQKNMRQPNEQDRIGKKCVHTYTCVLE